LHLDGGRAFGDRSRASRVQVEAERSGPLAWLRDRNNDPDGLLAKAWEFTGRSDEH
jgi:hypothetical protein